MRLKVIHDSRKSADELTRVVDADTGEPVKGVIEVLFHRTIDDFGELKIVLNDFEVEVIEDKAQIEPAGPHRGSH